MPGERQGCSEIDPADERLRIERERFAIEGDRRVVIEIDNLVADLVEGVGIRATCRMTASRAQKRS